MDRLLRPPAAMFSFEQLPEILLKLSAAFLLALPVAWEREVQTRLMGLRTFPIVAMASCLPADRERAVSQRPGPGPGPPGAVEARLVDEDTREKAATPGRSVESGGSRSGEDEVRDDSGRGTEGGEKQP